MVGEDEVTLVGIIPRLPISNQNLKQHDAYGPPSCCRSFIGFPNAGEAIKLKLC